MSDSIHKRLLERHSVLESLLTSFLLLVNLLLEQKTKYKLIEPHYMQGSNPLGPTL
jgi:hypothetical protein